MVFAGGVLLVSGTGVCIAVGIGGVSVLMLACMVWEFDFGLDVAFVWGLPV